MTAAADVRRRWRELYAELPRWQRAFEQELRLKVLLQAIKDADTVEFPSNIRGCLNQVELWIETHSGIYKEEPKE